MCFIFIETTGIRDFALLWGHVQLPSWLSDKKKIHMPMQGTWVPSLGEEDPLEEEKATRSCIPAWTIPWTEEPGGLQFMGSQSQTQLSD